MNKFIISLIITILLLLSTSTFAEAKEKDYKKIESYKDSEYYKAYLALSDKSKTPKIKKLYKDSYEAEKKVKKLPCSEGGTIDQFLTNKAEIPAIEDGGWKVYPWKNGFEVERILLLDQTMPLEYKWHVDRTGKVKPVNGKAIGITGIIADKHKKENRYYYKAETANPSDRIYEINDTITLHNSADTVVAIFKDVSLGNLTHMFTNGITANILDYKSLPDKPVVYKVWIVLKDGSEYTGWVAENVISN